MNKTTESPRSSAQSRSSDTARPPVRIVLTNLLLTMTLLVLLGVGVLVVVQVGFLETDHAAAAQGMLVLVISLLLVVAVLLLHIARMGRERVEELTLRNTQLELEREQSEQIAVADERARIAREMHDIVAHSLTVIIAMSDGASAAIDTNPALAKEALRTMSETGRTALNDTRRLVGVLRAPTEVPKNLDSGPSEKPEASSLEEVRFTPSPLLPISMVSTQIHATTMWTPTRSLNDLPLHCPRSDHSHCLKA